MCVFEGHAGGHARAVFETKEQARRFAERHAEAFNDPGMPLDWEDAGAFAVLRTQVGDYLITSAVAH